MFILIVTCEQLDSKLYFFRIQRERDNRGAVEIWFMVKRQNLTQIYKELANLFTPQEWKTRSNNKRKGKEATTTKCQVGKNCAKIKDQ